MNTPILKLTLCIVLLTVPLAIAATAQSAGAPPSLKDVFKADFMLALL